MNVAVLLGIAAVAPIVFALVSFVSSRSSGGDQGRAALDGLVVERVKARTRSPTVPSLPLGATSVRVELYGRARAVDVSLHRDDTGATMEDLALPYAALVPVPAGVESVGLEASSANGSAAEPLQCRIYVEDALVALNTGVGHVECDVTAASLPTR